MLEEIKNSLCKIGKKMNREQLFELSPIYLLTSCTENFQFVQYSLNDLLSYLEKKSIISESDAFINFSLKYNVQENQIGLYDESGQFKNSLAQWLFYACLKFHVEHGIVMINIEDCKEILNNYIWRRQFFLDIKKYKKHYLFFVFFNSSNTDAIQHLFEQEEFIMNYNMDILTTKDYFRWFVLRLEKYSVFLNETEEKYFKKLFTKYKNDINHHILELWIKSLLWNYYNDTNNDLCEFSDDLLKQVIDRCKNNNDAKIGFN